MTFEDVVNWLDGWLGSAEYFPYLLLGVGLFFTIYLGFPQLRFFGHAWGVLTGRHTPRDAPGDASHFQALSTALSGTVGTGNIGGVAFAIYLGGPAALFWMWMTALLGMTTKYVEVTLSHKYRRTDAKGKIAGGPMYYMEHGLNMKWLAVFFAIATVFSSFGTGNLPQSNNMAVGLNTSFGLPHWVAGAAFAALLGFVILGGISRIAKVAATLVPLMGFIYVTGALFVIGSNLDNLVPSFTSVFADAFTGSAAAGGFLGATFAYAFNRGVNRGLYSNEAGQGSAPIAHAAARTKEPAAEGMVAILEPFIDTLVICTITGMLILSSGVWTQKFETDFAAFDTQILEGVYTDTNAEHRRSLFAHLNGNGDLPLYNGDMSIRNGQIQGSSVTILHNRSVAEAVRVFDELDEPYNGVLQIADGRVMTPDVRLHGRSLLHSAPLTMRAFEQSVLGTLGPYIVSIGLALFAFSTALAWSYYGDRAITYLVGQRFVAPYRALYVVGFFLASIVDTSLIWLISAVTLALMTLPNLVAIVLLSKEVKQLTRDYRATFIDEQKPV